MSAQSDALHRQLDAVKANDEQTLQHLYAANYPAVERFVLQNSGTKADAKDVFQEAFTVMWRNVQLDKFTHKSEGSLNAYLFQIARHKWLDRLRSPTVKKTTTLEKEDETLMTFDQTDDTNVERLRTIKEKFRQLGDNCRELLIRFYYRRQSLKEIAASLEWTEATAKNNKYRCMQKLREMVVK